MMRCFNSGCDVKNECARYTDLAEREWHEPFNMKPYNMPEDEPCPYFVPKEDQYP